MKLQGSWLRLATYCAIVTMLYALLAYKAISKLYIIFEMLLDSPIKVRFGG